MKSYLIINWKEHQEYKRDNNNRRIRPLLMSLHMMLDEPTRAKALKAPRLQRSLNHQALRRIHKTMSKIKRNEIWLPNWKEKTRKSLGLKS